MHDVNDKIAIIGRPNVGKSALFNRIVGRRMAIVDRKPGITRDRLGAEAEWLGRTFTVIDTGGIGIGDDEPLAGQVRFQAEVAIAEASVIVFVTDVMEGIAPLDLEVARNLRSCAEKVIVVVNKCDNANLRHEASAFHQIGFSTLFPISALHGLGIDDLLDEAVNRLPEAAAQPEQQDYKIKIAVVGKPNCGKSTLINALLKENRLLVSAAPGTTRDSIDVAYQSPAGENFMLIDTAGIKRKKSIKQAVEKYSLIRSEQAIRRSDVVVMMVDAEAGLTTTDSKIAQTIMSEGKSCVIAANKWDLIHGVKQAEYRDYIYRRLKFLDFAPVVFLSAVKGKKIGTVMHRANLVYTESMKKITTPAINKLFQQALQKHQPPVHRGKRLKIYYVTQISTAPPKFLIFLNDPLLLKTQYLNYLENRIRAEYRFSGAPIKFELRNRSG